MPTELKLFRPDVYLSVGNIHEPIVDRALVGAAIEFCDKSRSWEGDLAPITVIPSQAEYTIVVPVERTLIGLTDVFLDGSPLPPFATVNLRRTTLDWNTKTEIKPTCWNQSSPTTIKFYPGFNADSSGEITLKGTFKPVRTVTSLEDFIYNDYHDAIVNGALYRLHSMKGKAWYSPSDAAEARAFFSREVSHAKIRARKSRTNDSYRVRVRGAA